MKQSRGRVDVGSAMKSVVARYGVLLVLVALVVAFSLLLPSSFPTVANWSVMVNSQAVLLMLALAVTLPLRNGDFDLSVAAILVLCSAVAGTLSRDGWPLVAVIIITLAIGALIGLVNGLLVVTLGLDSFVTTLGMLTALGGLAYAVTDNSTISSFSPSLLAFAQTDVLGVPLATWYGWILVLILWYVYERMPFGRFMLFIGGNRDAARLSGVPVARVRIASYMACATISAFAGVILAGYLGAVDPGIGPQFLLLPFAAAFLGATTVTVGRFNAVGTLIALYLLVVGVTGLQLYGMPTWSSDVFNGLALVGAVAFARFTARRVQS